MPKETFFKLKKEKQKRITEASIKEFSENSFELASINQIVRNSSIAKGSFYQYFEDKEDLYEYILDICVKKKEAHIEEILSENIDDVFENIEKLFRGTVKFYNENEKIYDILDFCARSREMNLKRAREKDFFSSKNVYNIIEAGVNEGSIKFSLDIYGFMRILSKINDIIVEHRKLGNTEEEYETEIRDTIELMKNGIGTERKKHSNRNIEDRFY